jgi:hypothetical protein
MDKTRLFDYLEKRNMDEVLGLLRSAYDKMNTKQRVSVFGQFYDAIPRTAVHGETLFKEIGKFYQESLAGEYYAPFEIDSKNFMDIPEETEEWFDRLGEFLESSIALSEQAEHSIAIKCFGLLYELILEMEEGDEIVFAHELGSWMIPGGEKNSINAYFRSLSLSSSPEEFTKATLPLIRRDSYFSFADKVCSSARRMANKEQRAYLNKEIKRQNIETSPRKG